MTTTMRALIAVPGTPEPVLRELPVPEPGAGEVLVRVAAAAINPADPFVLSGAAHETFGLRGPVGLGYDLAGTIERTGPGVPGELLGRSIAGLHDELAALSRAQAEFAVIPARAIAELPEGLAPQRAATIPLGTLTAAQGLELLGDAAERTLLVTGAAGSVGAYATALAVRAGWRVTGLARPGDRNFIASLNATPATQLPAAAFDAVFDAAAMQEDALAAVRDGGAFLGVLPPAPVAPARGITVSTVLVRADGAALARMLALHADGTLTARVDRAVPIERASEAYSAMGKPGRRGRLLITP